MKLVDIVDFDTLLQQPGYSAIQSHQRLRPLNHNSSIAGGQHVIFPPTYRGDEGAKERSTYSMGESPDGQLSVVLDKPASQFNRVEPMFKDPRYRSLVPEVKVVFGEQECDVLDLPHRVGDACIRNSDTWDLVKDIILEAGAGDITRLALMFPTSLVGGFWDSRGGTNTKLRRLWRSEIRAYGVKKVEAGVTIFPPFSYDSIEKDAGGSKKAGEAMQHRGMKPFSDGRNQLGGVQVSDGTQIVRTSSITINRIRAWVEVAQHTKNKKLEKAARYIFGLCLVAETAPQDHDLREGCILKADGKSKRTVITSNGEVDLEIDHETAMKYCKIAASDLGLAPSMIITLDPKKATKEVKEAMKGAGKDKD